MLVRVSTTKSMNNTIARIYRAVAKATKKDRRFGLEMWNDFIRFYPDMKNPFVFNDEECELACKSEHDEVNE